MVATAQTAMAQWQRIEALVQAWLGERQQLLHLLTTVRNACAHPQPSNVISERVQQFCEVLMDYISAGYFEIYRELAREARCFKRDNPALTHSIMQQLDSSTDEALAFNDDFDSEASIAMRYHQLASRLNALQEKMEERFALEDQLIVSIHQRDVPERTLVH